MNSSTCPCGSDLPYVSCCQPYHLKFNYAPTAEALMRSRYSAFVLADADYLYETTFAGKQKANSKAAYLKSAKNTRWMKLEIITAGYDTVEFKAYYFDDAFKPNVLHEKSNFKLADGKWYYVDGVFFS